MKYSFCTRVRVDVSQFAHLTCWLLFLSAIRWFSTNSIIKSKMKKKKLIGKVKKEVHCTRVSQYPIPSQCVENLYEMIGKNGFLWKEKYNSSTKKRWKMSRRIFNKSILDSNFFSSQTIWLLSNQSIWWRKRAASYRAAKATRTFPFFFFFFISCHNWREKFVIRFLWDKLPDDSWWLSCYENKPFILYRRQCQKQQLDII